MSETFSSVDQTLKNRGNHSLLIVYVTLAAFVLTLIVLFHYYRSGIFGTSLLLGWDSPGYVWVAKEVIVKGPIYMIGAWSYPHLYTQLLAFFGYLTGDVLIVERVLPMFFALLLIYANSRIMLDITNRIHITGLAAFLTVLSLNFLRILADLNRNLMALSLSMIAFLLVPRLGNIQPFPKKNYLFFIFLLLIIASTHFETYFIFSLSLVLYGVLSKNLKEALKLTLASAVPVVVLLLLFYPYFLGYMSTIIILERNLTFYDFFSWIGGSWLLLGLLIVGLSYLYREAKQGNKLGRLIFCWFLVTILVATLSGLHVVLPAEFAVRTLFLLPTPMVLALSVPACDAVFKSLPFALAIRRKFLTRIDIRRLFLLIVTFCLLTSSAFVVFYRADEFLTPYIPYSGYEKVLSVTDFIAKNGLSKPVVVFYGEPGFWFTGLYRNYIGMEIGEHFAYYGNMEDLFHLKSSEPKITYDPYLMKIERSYSSLYYEELLGNWSGPPPSIYFHEQHIRSIEDLMSHPIVVVTPDFYNDNVPYYMKPYYIGGGIYVIPPHSPINLTEVVYGPEITIRRDSTISGMRSQYSHIDPYDPSLVYLKLNCSSGYQSYNLTNLPSNLTFAWMEQGNDLSYPEHNPMRLDGTKAIVGNDPTESTQYWTTPIAEQEAALQIDPSTKKEGNSSLRITGKTDSWGSLTIRYDSPGTLDLAGYSSIGVWVKCNESAMFSLTLVDRYGGSRTFWAIRAGGSSAATSWKRLVANLTEYTSQTPDFRIDSVDHIDLFVSSSAGKNLSFWIDDLIVDTPPNLNAYIYKDRVPTNEKLIIYFYARVQDIPNAHKDQ
jgi:hypothetical protein